MVDVAFNPIDIPSQTIKIKNKKSSVVFTHRKMQSWYSGYKITGTGALSSS